ncbi:MAG: SAM-dependent methyltransferase [Saprospiraceae bacterium]|jgi:SAM-dependent methyltransferase
MDNKKFYETFDWASFKDADINIRHIVKIIPEGVSSILDVGCGNGLITNALKGQYNVIGVDRSKAALEFVTASKIEASCDDIPVEDKSFDMVLSSELLEHLDEKTFLASVKEFDRIAAKYLLISVPYNESINKGLIKCPSCAYVYHRNLHMRSFLPETIAKNFPDFDVVSHETFGLNVRKYHPFLSKIKHKHTPASSWIPKFWTRENPRVSLCPNCEQGFDNTYKFNLLSYCLDIMNVIISPKKPFWLMVLLKRK